MLTLFRLLFYAAAVYGAFLVAFPQWDGMVYHVASLAIIAGAAVGMFIFLKVFDLSSRLAKIALELGFAAVVALWFAWTMPQKSGKTPWEQWAEGHRPNQLEARDGFARIGVNPSSPAAAFIVSLFPR
ncbi:MAG: hypothetical protein HY077_12260 [Elusimicrobia bacterium]|nr:hypothetical protein [Elusimicrobiota bacterium]